MPLPIWVSQPQELMQMVEDLARYSRLAVDTESNSLYAYREQVCLLQFSTGETDYLVDPLALTDLSALAPIFASREIEKIFHAAEYDLICLKRDYGFTFAHIFDTMQAGRILGRTAVGLAAMLESEFGVTLDKRFQRANWGRRPLSQEMLAYARLDTHYLIPLRDRLMEALEESGRWALAHEDFARLCALSAPSSERETGSCWKVAGAQELTSQQAAILQALCEFRDRQAQNADLPPFKVFSNQALVEIALAGPQTIDELGQIRGLSRRQLDRYGKGLLQSVRRGCDHAPLYRPANHQRPNGSYLARLDALRFWRKRTAQQMGVESDIILPRDILERIAETNPRQMGELSPLMAGLPWRLDKFGRQILEVLPPPT